MIKTDVTVQRSNPFFSLLFLFLFFFFFFYFLHLLENSQVDSISDQMEKRLTDMVWLGQPLASLAIKLRPSSGDLLSGPGLST